MHYLIDGHNLIGRMPTLRLDDPNDEAKLLDYLQRYHARTGHHFTVIFDAGLSYHSPKVKKQGGITIQFASQGQSADQLIIQQVRRVKNPQEMLVVTSDRAVQQAARHAHVRVIAAEEFAQQLLTLASPVKKDEDRPVDIQLSADEVEAWLEFFKRSK